MRGSTPHFPCFDRQRGTYSRICGQGDQMETRGECECRSRNSKEGHKTNITVLILYSLRYAPCALPQSQNLGKFAGSRDVSISFSRTSFGTSQR